MLTVIEISLLMGDLLETTLKYRANSFVSVENRKVFAHAAHQAALELDKMAIMLEDLDKKTLESN